MPVPESHRVAHGEITFPRGNESRNRAAVYGLPRGIRRQLSPTSGRRATSIFVRASPNQEVTDSHDVRTLVVYPVVCRALKLVIDPAIFIDRDNLFDEQLATGIRRV